MFLRRFKAIFAACVSTSSIVGLVNQASADIFLMVNVDTGNVRIYGAEGDVLTRYEIKTTAADWSTKDSIINTSNSSFNRTLFNSTRFGATNNGVTTSVSAGYGTWHTHGLADATGTSDAGYAVTYRIAEMCAVKGSATSVALYFGENIPDNYPSNGTAKTILPSDSFGYYLDLGNVFIPGSPLDLIFTYTDQPGYANNDVTGGIANGPDNTTVSNVNSPHYGSYTNVTPITSYADPLHDLNIVDTYIVYVPEPASAVMLSMAGVGVLMMRRQRKS